MGLVIDTSAFIAVERQGRSADDVFTAIGDEVVVLPAITLAELLAGVRLADTPVRAAARRARIDALVARVPVVPLESSTAERWAEIFATLQRDGTPIPSNDMMIAATALEHDFGVLVGPHGEAHFKRVPGLRVATLG